MVNNATVSSVQIFSQLRQAPKIEFIVHLTDFDLTKAEAKATYEEIKQYIRDCYGIKVSQLNIAQVKRKYGIIERACYNKSKRKVPIKRRCTPDKEIAIVDALTFYQMIP